ncbi:MAG TPA: hypothetical protein VKM54_06065 [Myxococcota bacterium]|nr:hypothetical protein [Myxococcota bacterium]
MLILLPLIVFASDAEQAACPTAAPGATGAGKPEAQSLPQRLEAGPFYREMVRRFGKPLSCKLASSDGNVSVTYGFRGDAVLTGRTNEPIESSEQKIELPRMARTKAIALLKAGEKDSYAPDGCGIDWEQPEEEADTRDPASRDVIYRGDTCNCQARLKYRKGWVVSLILKSAC